MKKPTTKEIAERFFERFRGLDRAHGTYILSGGKDQKKNKVTGRAKTIKENVTIGHWVEHIEGRVGIGIVPINDDSICRFGAIDVDVYDLNLEALEARIERLKFPLVVCRTKSGGAHLFAFFNEPIPAGLVRDRLMEWSVVLGYPNSEIFPKQSEMKEDDLGSWINMPYFGGSSTTRYAIYKGEALDPIGFLDHADKSAVNRKEFEDVKSPRDDRVEEAPPCLEHLSNFGFPEGTRNKGLFNLGVYCRLRYPDDWKTKIDEFNQSFMKPPLSSSEVKVIIGSLNKKKYFYTCKDLPLMNVCNKAICVKRKYGIGGSDNDPGVVIDNLVKVTTDPPTWAVNVDGKKITLRSTDDLLNQNSFRTLCVETINVLPQAISRPAWDDIVRDLLEKVEEIDAPEDAGSPGQFVFLLEQYCTEHPEARNRDEILLGKPWIEGGYTYFRSPDLLSFMDKKKLRINARDAWGILRDMKGKTEMFKVKGRTVRCWGIPSPEKQKEPFDVPSIPNEEKY